jgi:ubiquinone/menaquinone biosynthesis C-methylase UbiE
LRENFKPKRLIGLEYDSKTLNVARARAEHESIPVEFLQNDCAEIDLPDGVADMVFCHQVCHHLVRQEQSLAEFYRILKPGGVLLFAESTKAYIHSWLIRYLFAHPMDKQRTAQEYIDMVRAAGFQVPDESISYPYLWWSRSDLGVAQNIFKIQPKPFGQREETLVNLVALKPI